MKKIISLGLALITVLLCLTACAIKQPAKVPTPQDLFIADYDKEITIGPMTEADYEKLRADSLKKEQDHTIARTMEFAGYLRTRTDGEVILDVPGMYKQIESDIGGTPHLVYKAIGNEEDQPFPAPDTQAQYEKFQIKNYAGSYSKELGEEIYENIENPLTVYNCAGITYDLEFGFGRKYSDGIKKYYYNCYQNGELKTIFVEFDENNNIINSSEMPIAKIEIDQNETPENAVKILEYQLNDQFDFSQYNKVTVSSVNFNGINEAVTPKQSEDVFGLGSYVMEYGKEYNGFDCPNVAMRLIVRYDGYVYLSYRNMVQICDYSILSEDLDYKKLDNLVRDFLTPELEYRIIRFEGQGTSYKFDTLKNTSGLIEYIKGKTYLTMEYQIRKTYNSGGYSKIETEGIKIYIDLTDIQALPEDSILNK